MNGSSGQQKLLKVDALTALFNIDWGALTAAPSRGAGAAHGAGCVRVQHRIPLLDVARQVPTTPDHPGIGSVFNEVPPVIIRGEDARVAGRSSEQDGGAARYLRRQRSTNTFAASCGECYDRAGFS